MVQISSKRPETDDDDHDEDLISKLPDELLVHILSCFSTKEAVSTSILSKRWKLVWISAPNLEFDVKNRFPMSQSFVDRVLSLNNVRPLRCAKLSFHGSVLRVNVWLEALVMREPETFVLSLPFSFMLIAYNTNLARHPYLLPDSFYNQKNLVELRLHHVVLKVPPSVYFPCLKAMKLFTVELLGDESIKHLLSGSPLITELHLEQYKCKGITRLDICSATLQKLYICINAAFYFRVLIDAPNLRHLIINGAKVTYDMIDVALLVKAQVSRIPSENQSFALLKQISHVQELFLDQLTLKEYESQSFPELPKFDKLIHLTLQVDVNWSLRLLLLILHYTPNVVHIVIEFKGTYAHLPGRKNPLDSIYFVLSCVESAEFTQEMDRRAPVAQLVPVVSCSLKTVIAFKKLTFRGLPLDLARENCFLKSLLSTCQV